MEKQIEKKQKQNEVENNESQRQKEKVETQIESQQSNIFDSLLHPDKLIGYAILTTRIGFILIFLMCIMMNGQFLNHFIVLFFLTFGLNCALLYYRNIKNQVAQTPTLDQKNQ